MYVKRPVAQHECHWRRPAEGALDLHESPVAARFPVALKEIAEVLAQALALVRADRLADQGILLHERLEGAVHDRVEPRQPVGKRALAQTEPLAVPPVELLGHQVEQPAIRGLADLAQGGRPRRLLEPDDLLQQESVRTAEKHLQCRRRDWPRGVEPGHPHSGSGRGDPAVHGTRRAKDEQRTERMRFVAAKPCQCGGTTINRAATASCQAVSASGVERRKSSAARRAGTNASRRSARVSGTTPPRAPVTASGRPSAAAASSITDDGSRWERSTSTRGADSATRC